MMPLELWPGIALLRPAWLLALPILTLIVWWRWRSTPVTDEGPWATLIDAHLQPALLDPGSPKTPMTMFWQTCVHSSIVLISILALAGPATYKDETVEKVLRPATTRLLLIDLSPRFAALPEATQTQLRLKLRTLLDILPPAETALAVHDDAEPYLVVPPTTDTASVARWLPELSASAMPSVTPPASEAAPSPPSSNSPDTALHFAAKIIQDNGGHGELIWISPAAPSELDAALARQHLPGNPRIKMLHIGTTASDNTTTLSGRPPQSPVLLAEMSANNTDILLLASPDESQIAHSSADTTSYAKTANWVDLGPSLVLLLLPLGALAWWIGVDSPNRVSRTSLGFVAILIITTINTPPAFAAEHTPSSTVDPRWQAVGHYRTGDFARAAALLEPFSDADSLYNRGNALARLGRFEDALGLYEAALQIRPDDTDFQHNRDLIADLIKPPPSQDPPPPPDQPPPPPKPLPPPPAPKEEAGRIAEQWLRRVPDVPPSTSKSSGQDSLLKQKLTLEAARRAEKRNIKQP